MLTWFKHEITIIVKRDRKPERNIGLVIKDGNERFRDGGCYLVRNGFPNCMTVYRKLFSPQITGINNYFTQGGTIGSKLTVQIPER